MLISFYKLMTHNIICENVDMILAQNNPLLEKVNDHLHLPKDHLPVLLGKYQENKHRVLNMGILSI